MQAPRHQPFGGVCGRPSGESSHVSRRPIQRGCGAVTHAELRCAHCGERLHAADVDVEPGPGPAVAASG